MPEEPKYPVHIPDLAEFTRAPLRAEVEHARLRVVAPDGSDAFLQRFDETGEVVLVYLDFNQDLRGMVVGRTVDKWQTPFLFAPSSSRYKTGHDGDATIEDVLIYFDKTRQAQQRGETIDALVTDLPIESLRTRRQNDYALALLPNPPRLEEIARCLYSIDLPDVEWRLVGDRVNSLVWFETVDGGSNAIIGQRFANVDFKGLERITRNVHAWEKVSGGLEWTQARVARAGDRVKEALNPILGHEVSGLVEGHELEDVGPTFFVNGARYVQFKYDPLDGALFLFVTSEQLAQLTGNWDDAKVTKVANVDHELVELVGRMGLSSDDGDLGAARILREAARAQIGLQPEFGATPTSGLEF